ncbi:epoxide hydrolase [Pseudonocardia eucalypti]|uniref:Epoxide hydrolase n=1 Tax=Pseudonocardia eucalypti TaxID=648755 RepID=A0ABP9QMS1_9PSEU|nr:pimeloyl-ACP methyl ester carboxylesterase [Pseudonocardia eucalypti]
MDRSGRVFSRREWLRATVGAGVAFGLAGPLATACGSAGPDRLVLPEATDAVTPFALRVPEGVLDDLRRRLAATRWPERETVPDSAQGPQLDRVRRLVAHWSTEYDWRKAEARLNGAGQFRTRLDGLGIHFLHARSRHENAFPLLLTHGWPGSVVEFLGLVGPLTDPTAFGGSAGDAFHLVVPSLPGFGFSDKPAAAGWNSERIARAWAELMNRLGYPRYLAQGGDWGADVTARLAKLKPANLTAIHLNFFGMFSPPVAGEPNPEERVALASLRRFGTDGFGYFAEQGTRPQQVGYGLTDSPAGQAAWIYEKFTEWTDSNRDPEALLGYDHLLDNIMLHWLPATAASSARIYWENFKAGDVTGPFGVPVGFSAFPKEILPMPRVWAERVFRDKLVYFNQVDRGGHFAALEQPALFAEELRKFARLFR